MTFRDTLGRWPSHAVIRGAAVVSEDGMLVHDDLPATVDGEAVAALALALLGQAEQLGAAAGGDEVGAIVVELDRGPAVVTRLDAQHTLVVLAHAERDIGPLLFDIRRDRALLGAAV